MEVVGLAGLLSISEVAQIISTVRQVTPPPGRRPWRCSPACAGAWALSRSGGCGDGPSSSTRGAPPRCRRSRSSPRRAADADTATLADALAILARPRPTGGGLPAHHRTRSRTGPPGLLTHPVGDRWPRCARVLGVGWRSGSAARPDGVPGSGAEHLDRFADVVARYAGRPGADAGPAGHLDAAAEVENGCRRPRWCGRRAGPGAHRACGQGSGVADRRGPASQCPGVPSTASATWLTDAAELPPLLRGDRAGSAAPEAAAAACTGAGARHLGGQRPQGTRGRHRGHRRQLLARSVDEERRLLYVAITRAEDTLLLSGHHWGQLDPAPRGPSDFLGEIRDVIDRSRRGGLEPCGWSNTGSPGARAARGGTQPVARHHHRGGVARRPAGRRAPRSNAVPGWCPRDDGGPGTAAARTTGHRRGPARLDRRRRCPARRTRPRRRAGPGDAAHPVVGERWSTSTATVPPPCGG